MGADPARQNLRLMLYLPLHEMNAVLNLPKFYLDVRKILPRFKRMTGAIMACQPGFGSSCPRDPLLAKLQQN